MKRFTFSLPQQVAWSCTGSHLLTRRDAPQTTVCVCVCVRVRACVCVCVCVLVTLSHTPLHRTQQVHLLDGLQLVLTGGGNLRHIGMCLAGNSCTTQSGPTHTLTETLIIMFYNNYRDTSLVVKRDPNSKDLSPVPTAACYLVSRHLVLEIRTNTDSQNTSRINYEFALLVYRDLEAYA